VATRTDAPPAPAAPPATRRTYEEIAADLEAAEARLRELIRAGEQDRAKVQRAQAHRDRVILARKRALQMGLVEDDLELNPSYEVPPLVKPNPIICSDLHQQHYLVKGLEDEMNALGVGELARGRHAEAVRRFGHLLSGPPVSPADAGAGR
jgi:hypothetical protein